MTTDAQEFQQNGVTYQVTSNVCPANTHVDGELFVYVKRKPPARLGDYGKKNC